MKFFITVAWRNIWRNARRSLITATAMAVSVGLCMAMITLNDGFYGKFFDVLVTQSLGHVQIQNPNYLKTKNLHESIKNATLIMDGIKENSNTFAATARLHGNVLVGGPEKSAGAMVTGVVPEDEIPITKADQQIIEGKYLSTEDSTGVIVGITLYEDLDIKLQDELFLFTQGSDGSMAYGLYNVVGVYKSGSTLKDRGILMNLPALQEMLIMEDQVHEFILLGKDENNIETYKSNISKTIAQVPNIEVIVEEDQQPKNDKNVLIDIRTWWEASPDIYNMMGMRDVATGLFLGIIFFIAGFGILNTMLMSVFERTRELGILKALGLRPNKMIFLILIESVFLSGIAAFLGCVFGGFLNWYLVTYGIDISGGTGEPLPIMGATFEPIVKGLFSLEASALPVIALFCISVLASLWPAYRASRLEPVHAIRQE